LFDAVNKLSLQQQEQFLLALENTQQSHVTNYLRNGGSVPALYTENWPLFVDNQWKRVEENLWRLKELIDTRNGLLDELLSVQLVNNQQKQVISAQLSDADCNELLLSIIQRKSLKDYNLFIDCLEKNKQNHVVAVLEPNSSTFNSQPVNEQQLVTLRANYAALVKLIQTNRY
jgi:hypothetical protein